jgi:hypothetical protein
MIWMFAIFLSIGHAQPAANIAPYLRSDKNAEKYEGSVSQGDRSWNKLKDDVVASLSPGATFYTSPETAVQGASNLMPQQYCTPTPSDGSVHGRLIMATRGVSVIQLDALPGTCGAYNSDQPNRNLVFVKTGDIQDLTAREDFNSAAGASGVTPCSDCGNSEDQAVLNDLANTHLEKHEKTAEELEAYIKCYATAHQSNYDRFYKKLFDLAGTYGVSYVPSIASGKNKKPAVVKPILTAADYNYDASGKAFFVHPSIAAMKCLALRESGWNPASESPTHAQGIGQQTPVNVKDMECLLEGCKGRPPEAWAQAIWKNYMAKARSLFTKKEWDELNQNPITHQRCVDKMSVKERDAPCAVNSIRAVLLYQMATELAIRRSSSLYKDSDGDFSPKEAFHKDLLTGTGNNAGIGATAKVAGQVKSPFQWLHNISHFVSKSRSKEVGDYRDYLRNCIAADSWDSVWGGENKDCRKFKAKAK